MSTNADDGKFNPMVPEGPPPGADYDPTTTGTGTEGLREDDATDDDESEGGAEEGELRGVEESRHGAAGDQDDAAETETDEDRTQGYS